MSEIRKPRLSDVEARTDVGPDLLHDPDSRTVVQSVDRYVEMVDDLTAMAAAIRALYEAMDRHHIEGFVRTERIEEALSAHIDLAES